MAEGGAPKQRRISTLVYTVGALLVIAVVCLKWKDLKQIKLGPLAVDFSDPVNSKVGDGTSTQMACEKDSRTRHQMRLDEINAVMYDELAGAKTDQDRAMIRSRADLGRAMSAMQFDIDAAACRGQHLPQQLHPPVR